MTEKRLEELVREREQLDARWSRLEQAALQTEYLYGILLSEVRSALAVRENLAKESLGFGFEGNPSMEHTKQSLETAGAYVSQAVSLLRQAEETVLEKKEYVCRQIQSCVPE